MIRIVATVAVCAALSLATTACRDDAPSEANRPDGSGAVTPVAPPSEYREVAGLGFTISAPPSYPSESKTGTNGEPVLVLRVEADDATVSVVRDSRPRAPAAEQAATLEKVTRTADRGTEIDRQQVAWPGTTSAFLVRWVEAQAEGAGHRSVRVWQLLAQVDDSLIINVVASAPLEAFERLQLDTVLRTFRPVS